MKAVKSSHDNVTCSEAFPAVTIDARDLILGILADAWCVRLANSLCTMILVPNLMVDTLKQLRL